MLKPFDVEAVTILAAVDDPWRHARAASLLARVPAHARRHVDAYVAMATQARLLRDYDLMDQLITRALAWPRPPLTVVQGEQQPRSRKRKAPKLRAIPGGRAAE